jgi:hypothetical protein
VKTKKKKLFIAIPSYKFINIEAVHCMFSLLSETEDGRMLALHGGEGAVMRSRNNICSKFLESDFDELLQIDSDILYTPQNVNRIASLDVPIVAAFYCKKSPGKPVWIANRTAEGGSLAKDPDERGLVKVETIGTGFMKVQRAVLEKMRDSHLAARYIVDGTDIVEYEFFPFRVVNGRLRSEDWAFCDNAHALGFDVYADTQNVVMHMGTAIYPTLESKIIEATLKAVQKLQARGEKVPQEIFDALALDPAYNVAK